MENHELAKAAGTPRQQVFKLRTGVTRMSPEWAKRFAPHLGVEWPQVIADMQPAPISTDDRARARPVTISVPELDVRAQGGSGSDDAPLNGDGQHLVLAEWTLPVDYLRAYVASPAAARIIRIVGDSMEPHYNAGDRVLVDTSHQTPSPPGVYVIWDGFGLVLKHVEVLAGRRPATARLSSDNPAYSPYEVPVEDLKVQGRVMGKWVWK